MKKTNLIWIFVLILIIYSLSVNAWVNCTPSSCDTGYTDNGITCTGGDCARNCTTDICSNSWSQVHSTTFGWGTQIEDEQEGSSSSYQPTSSKYCYNFTYQGPPASTDNIRMDIDPHPTYDCRPVMNGGFKESNNWFSSFGCYIGSQTNSMVSNLCKIVEASMPGEDDADQGYLDDASGKGSIYCAPNSIACNPFSLCDTDCYNKSTYGHAVQGYYRDQGTASATINNGAGCGNSYVDNNKMTPVTFAVYEANVTVQHNDKTCDRTNEAPIASNVKVIPQNPTAGDDLICNFTYIDPENFEEKDSVFDWRKNGVSQGINSQILGKGNLSVNNKWNCELIPSDGLLNGTKTGSSNVTILSTVQNPKIYVGDSLVWSSYGYYADTEIITNFVEELNNALQGCTADGEGYCNISIKFSSNSSGKINASDVRVYYTYEEGGQKQNGESCTQDSECQSNYCDNDGVGWSDDYKCFSVESTYYDNQDHKCEEKARAANDDWCDEKRNESINTCNKTGQNYFEDNCSDTCVISDKNNICRSANSLQSGDGCTAPSQCNGITSNSYSGQCSYGSAYKEDFCSSSCAVSDGTCEQGCGAISQCDEQDPGYDYASCTTGGYNYFADQCSSNCQGEDRGDNICRSSSFATGCAALSYCNGYSPGYDIVRCDQAGQTHFADECSSSCQAQEIGDNICRSSAYGSGCTASAFCNSKSPGDESTSTDECCYGSCTSLDCDSDDDTNGGDGTLKESEVNATSCIAGCSSYSTCCNQQSITCSAVYECDYFHSLITNEDETPNNICYRNNSGNWRFASNAEIIEINCNDGYDNDCDGYIDGSDSDCDTTPPFINILSPINNTQYSTTFVDLNWTANETLDWCAYSLDGGANDTSICPGGTPTNITLTELSEGSHNITIYGNDTAGNMGQSDYVYFTTETAIQITNCAKLSQAGGTYSLAQDIIDSSNSSCMNISANHVTLDCQGHTIDGNDIADYGIYIYRSSIQTSNVTLKDCIIKDWDTAGVYINLGQSNNLTNIITHSNPDEGVYLLYSDNSHVTGSNFTQNRDGIYIYYSNNVELTNIYSLNNSGYDVLLYTSRTSNDCGATFTNVIGTDNLPIVFYNKTQVNIQDWNNNASEIILCYCDNSSIDNLYLKRTDTENNGLFIVASNNISVTNSNFTDLETGIYSISSNANVFDNITSFSNYNGLYLYSSDSNKFSNISAYSNTFGLYSLYGDYNNFVQLSAFSNAYGFYVYYSISNNFTEINSYSNSRGFYLYKSDSNKIADSIIRDNTYGVYIHTDTGGVGQENLFYNNLFNQSINVYFYDNDNNFWNTSKQLATRIYGQGNYIGGNYWTNSSGNGYSDVCTDSDSDGFCDSPYTLAANNVDYAPLSDEYGALIDLYDFFMIKEPSATHKIFEFKVKNVVNENLTNLNWSLDTGLETINSIYAFNLSPNNFSIVFVEYNYTQTGNFMLTASATDGTSQDSETITIDVQDIEASNLTLLYNNSLNRIFAFTISNMISSSLNSVNWTFKPGDGNVISANQLFSLNSSENAFVFIQYNYTSTGTYNANATSINGSLKDSINYTFTIT